jgi:hypothetical protein
MWINESNIVKWCKRSCLQWKFRGAAAVVPVRRGYVRSQLVLPHRNEFGKTLERLALVISWALRFRMATTMCGDTCKAGSYQPRSASFESTWPPTKLLWLGGCVTTCGGTPQNTGGGATTSRMSTSIDVRWRKYTTSTEGQDLNQRILNNHLQYVYCTYFYVTICLSGLVLPLLVPFCFILNIIATSECTDRFQIFNVFGI